MQKNDPIELQRPAETRRTVESKPVDLNIILYVIVAACIGFLLILAGGWLLVELVRQQFGDEGVRMILMLAGVMVLYFVISWTHSKVRRDNLHDLTEVQRVAVQSIILHQRADDQGEVMRDLVPTAFRVMAENQNRGQQLATEIVRHGRFLADSEAKAARNTKTPFPFDMVGTEEEIEELI